ncbi:MAG: T9SS type A sorting domain-containing protein [Bacteroidia bacterium]|nr:T9SS type A sorting domain-containing protein [Bacteroidia bacterium]
MEPEELSLWLYIDNAHCGQDDGGALVMITGGTMPYNILWDDDSTQTADTAFNLYSGMYHVYVDDSNGCATDDSIMVYDIDGPTLSVEGVWDVSCFGGNDGSAEVSTIDGTEPFMYMWSDGQTTEDAWSLMMGDHYLTVTDDAGCMAYDTVSISEPEALKLSMKSTDVKCNGVCDGSLVASVSGGTLPYNYTWNDTLGSTSFTFGLCAGNYTLSVVDANGCIVGTANMITEPDLLVLELDSIANSGSDIDDGMAIVTVTGGVTPYNYLWDDPNSQTTDTASGLYGFFYYTVIITDSNGCVASDSIYVDQLIGINQLEGVSKFNLYPNPSKGFVTIEVDLNNEKATELEIMNETGQLVYKTELNNTGIIRKELDLSKFSKGIYQIKIITSQSVITRQLFLVR